MNLCIRDRTNQLSEHNRKSLERDLHFALSRIANEIEYVAVKTEDINGLRDGVDKRCQIRAKTHRHGTVEVTQECDEIDSGLARAARRLGHRLSRVIKQKRQVKRGTILRLEESD